MIKDYKVTGIVKEDLEEYNILNSNQDTLCVVVRIEAMDEVKLLEYKENEKTTIVLVNESNGLDYAVDKYKNDITHIYISEYIRFSLDIIKSIPEHIVILFGEINLKDFDELSKFRKNLIACRTY